VPEVDETSAGLPKQNGVQHDFGETGSFPGSRNLQVASMPLKHSGNITYGRLTLSKNFRIFRPGI
jgi:hypothetical protein